MIEYLNYAGLSHFFDKLKAFFAKKTQSIKNISRNGTTFTATRADGSTFTFDQQTPAAATTTTAGLMPPLNQNSSTYLNGTGNWTNPTPSLVNTQQAGLAPNLSGDSTTFLDGTGNWTTPPYPQAVNTQQAGLAPVLNGNSNTYLDGMGQWTSPTPPLVSEYGPGAMPALNGNSNTYFDGMGQWTTPPLASQNSSGAMPALNGDSTTFLNGAGNWATPSAGLKCYFFSTDAGEEYLDIRFSQTLTSDDYFIVWGRASRQGWNSGDSSFFGILAYSDYDQRFYWSTQDVEGRIATYDNNLYTPSSRSAWQSSTITSGTVGGYLVINPFTSNLTKFRFYCGEHARLWFLTTSDIVMTKVV